jgi:RNase P/RNase MRP subunit p30
MDLNIKAKISSEGKERLAIIRKIAELGWDSIAWNQVALGKASQRTMVKPKEPVQLTTVDIAEIMKSRCLISESSLSEIKQYNRITMVVDDIADAQGITANNDHLRSFDIVAAQPGNAKVFAHICKSADVDIICFDFTRRIPFQINKKIVSSPFSGSSTFGLTFLKVDQAIERGIQFEIIYGPIFYCKNSFFIVLFY